MRTVQGKGGGVLATVAAEFGLGDMTDHFIPRRRYRGDGHWKWRMQRKGRQVTGRGDYLLITSRHTFFNSGFRYAWIHTDHKMVLVDI